MDLLSGSDARAPLNRSGSSSESAASSPSRAQVVQDAALSRRSKTLFVFIVTAFVALFGVGATVQSVYIYSLGLSDIRSDELVPSLLTRLAANGSAIVLVMLFAWVSDLHDRRGWSAVGFITLFAAVIAAVRMGIQLIFHVHPVPKAGVYFFDAVMAVIVVILGIALARLAVRMQQRVADHARRFAEEQGRSSAALAALQAEELRVRREVADELHGTVQHALIVVETEIRHIIESAAGVSHPEHDHAIQRLRAIVAQIEEVREKDVRQVSHALYPSGINVSLAQAVRAITTRIPESITVEVTIDEEVVLRDGPGTEDDRGLTPGQRLLFVRVLEEAISNALQHGNASHLTVNLTTERHPVKSAVIYRLCVDDNGGGMAIGEVQYSGLAWLASRLEQAGGRLDVATGPLGGVRVDAQLTETITAVTAGSEPEAVVGDIERG